MYSVTFHHCLSAVTGWTHFSLSDDTTHDGVRRLSGWNSAAKQWTHRTCRCYWTSAGLLQSSAGSQLPVWTFKIKRAPVNKGYSLVVVVFLTMWGHWWAQQEEVKWHTAHGLTWLTHQKITWQLQEAQCSEFKDDSEKWTCRLRRNSFVQFSSLNTHTHVYKDKAATCDFLTAAVNDAHDWCLAAEHESAPTASQRNREQQWSQFSSVQSDFNISAKQHWERFESFCELFMNVFGHTDRW